VRVNCSRRDEQAVTRFQGYGRLAFLLPDTRSRQDVERDCSWMQMARVHAAWLVLCLVHGHFLVRCVGQYHLQQRGMRDHSLPFLAASRSYREEQSESCYGQSFGFRERTHDLISLLQLRASIRLSMLPVDFSEPRKPCRLVITSLVAPDENTGRWVGRPSRAGNQFESPRCAGDLAEEQAGSPNRVGS